MKFLSRCKAGGVVLALTLSGCAAGPQLEIVEGGAAVSGLPDGETYRWRTVMHEEPYTYPELTDIGAGYVINLDPLREYGAFELRGGELPFLDEDCQATASIDVAFEPALADALVGRYVYWGDASNCSVVENLRLIHGHNVPAWIHHLAIETYQNSMHFLRRSLGEAPETQRHTLILAADLSPEKEPNYRADVGWRNTVFMRFHGEVWAENDPSTAATVVRTVAHEAIHNWVDAQAFLDSEGWLHEGAAEYLSFLMLNHGVRATDERVLQEATKRYPSCEGLQQRRTWSEYHCGFLFFWLYDLALTAQNQSIFDVMKGVIQNPEAVRTDLGGDAARAEQVLRQTDERERAQRFDDYLSDWGLNLLAIEDLSSNSLINATLRNMSSGLCDAPFSGFWQRDDHLILDFGDPCRDTWREVKIGFINGLAVRDFDEQGYLAVRQLCADSKPVTLHDTKGVVVASVVCDSTDYRPRMTYSFGFAASQ